MLETEKPFPHKPVSSYSLTTLNAFWQPSHGPVTGFKYCNSSRPVHFQLPSLFLVRTGTTRDMPPQSFLKSAVLGNFRKNPEVNC